MEQLAAVGQFAFWALLAYLSVRVGGLALRGQLGAALASPRAGLFAAEMVLCGVIPLVLFGTRRLRENPVALFWAAFLACGGVVLNRANVVIFGLDLKGPIPQEHPQSYAPSVYEWGLSLGLIAATIFLFGWAVRNLPILSKEEPAQRA